MADWRDERMGEEGDLWHRALIDPALLEVVGPVRGLRVLEIACGNGYLARRFASLGARSVVGIDLSRKTLARAIARERSDPKGVRFLRADASHLPQFSAGSFDLVVANMGLMDIEDGEGTIREVGRVLSPGGRFVFSISHPCFDIDDLSMWVVERAIGPSGRFGDTVWRKVTGYRHEGKRPIPWPVAPDRTVFTDSFHRTLTTYSRYLRAAGLVVRRLEEPAPRPEMLEGSPQGRYIAEIPLHLVVEAVRPSPIPGSRSPAGSRAVVAPRSRSGGRRRRTGSGRPGSTQRS
jgi:SAM-dependent methyltransferase